MKLRFPLLLTFLASPLALAAAAPIDARIFVGKATAEPASFLVVLREQADLTGAERIGNRTDRIRFVYESLKARAEVSQRSLVERLRAAGVPFRSHYLVNMIEVEAPRSLAGELAARQDVASVAANRGARQAEPPRPASAEEISPLEAADVEPNIERIGAPAVWDRGFTGQGIVIGMADTGLTWDHPALKAHYRGFDGVGVSHDHNWHDSVHDPRPGNACGADSAAPCDDDGHGTSTASLAVGDDGEGNQIGVAPGARFIGCRNMDRGVGTPERYTECFEFFLAPTERSGANPRPDLAPHVISNSWSCPASEGCTDPDVLRSVVENVRAAGILVVVSAGNEGPNCSTVGIPATYDAVLSVGATTSLDTIADFSSRGTVTADGSDRIKPDVCAPGTGLKVAAMPTGYKGGFSGTSGSCPQVAGAAALLFSAAPSLIGKPAAAAALLEQSAVRLTSSQTCDGIAGTATPNPVFGWGRIDVESAVAFGVPPARSAPVRPPGTRTPRRLSPRG